MVTRVLRFNFSRFVRDNEIAQSTCESSLHNTIEGGKVKKSGGFTLALTSHVIFFSLEQVVAFRIHRGSSVEVSRWPELT